MYSMAKPGRKTVIPLTQPDKAQFKGKIWEQEVLLVVILLLLCFFLFFFELGRDPLWDGDEGMHAATSKDMILSGDWITPMFNGEKFYDKPVLYNWLVSLSFLAFGYNEFAARLPSALLGTGCVIVVYLLGRNMFGPMAGFLSGMILATSGEHVILSRVVVHDIALAFFVTSALYFFYMSFKNKQHRKRYLLLFYASSGFSVVAKGPVGVLLPALIVGCFLIWQRRIDFLKELLTPWGILLFMMIATPWYILIILRNRDYGSYFFIQQNLMNFLSSEARHSSPFYYYFPVLLGGFFPWSCFLPLALIRAFRFRTKRIDEGVAFLVVWFLVIFLFFSLARSKLPTYLLPMFPAVSCLVGFLWHHLLDSPTPKLRKGFLYSFLLLVGTFLIAMIYININLPENFEPDYGLDLLRFKYHGLAFLGTLVLPLGLFLKGKLEASFFTLTGAIVLAILFVLLMVVPSMNPYRSTKGFALKLDRLLAPGEKLVFGRVMRDSALFYTNREALVLTTRKELTGFLDSNERVYCVIRRSLIESDEKLRPMAHIIDQEGHKVIISNKR
jgi:4-amino-4-deoxy-L-arabinose transferase-like glycosyltransferase